MLRIIVALVIVVSISGCGERQRRYELRGQILAVNRTSQELTIKHDDIRGFMPGMTMPFKVRDERLMAGREPGELVTATLVVVDNGAYLDAIRRTGMAPLAEAPPPAPVILNPGDEVADVPLIDQHGRARRLADWRGVPVAVTFIYTRCPLPDYCPRMDQRFAEARRAIEQDPQLRDRVRLLSVSFDRAHDTPATLASHAARVGADGTRWTLVTGAAAEIDQFALQFGLSVVRANGQQTEVVHSLRTAVLDANGRLAAVLSGNEWQTSELLNHLRSAHR